MPQLISNQPVELVFHTLRGGIDPGDHLLFVPGSSKLYMYGRISDPGMILYPPRMALPPRTPANQPVGLEFPHRAGRYRPRGPPLRPLCAGVADAWKAFSSGDGTYHLLSSPGATGSCWLYGYNNPVPFQPSRKSQQPLAWIWPTVRIVIGQ